MSDEGPNVLARSGAAIDQTFSSLPPETTALPCKPPTWVEICLRDADGKPVPNVAFRIDLPDGGVLEGRLDGDGLGGVDGIDPGNCKVTFPELTTPEVTRTG